MSNPKNVLVLIFSIFVMFLGKLEGADRIDDTYCIFYGNPDADLCICEYISLTCPTCIALYRRDFERIRQDYIDTEKVQWIFSLVPFDMITLQLMVCLEQLSETEKKVFFEAIITSSELETHSHSLSSELNYLLLQTGMRYFGKSIPDIRDLTLLQNTKTFQEAFRYMNEADVVLEVPTIEVREKLYQELPTHAFVGKIIRAFYLEDCDEEDHLVNVDSDILYWL